MKTAGWIPAERVAALPVTHDWDDSNPYRVVENSDPVVARRAVRLSPRAKIAFTLACAEWVLARFDRLYQDPRPWQYLEARWAALVDPGFGELRDDVVDDDEGPVRGPIALALATATDAFRTRDAGDPGFASALARHVVPDGSFDRWRDACLERLEKRHARGTERAVAREGLGVELEDDEESRLVRGFLRRLDAAKNPYLVPTRH